MNKAAKVIEHEETSVLVDESGSQIATKDIQPLKVAAKAPAIVDHNPYVQMIAVAAAQDVDVEKLEKLMDLQERWEDRSAKKEYLTALASFAENPPVIAKDKVNTQYDSNYVSLENTTNTLVAALAPFGLKHRWTIDQSAGIAVTCILSHVGGHSETVTIVGPPDTTGKKNEIQQIKSTITYLKLATLESVTGTASATGSLSDDGNSYGATTITLEQAAGLRDEVAAIEGDEKFFCNWLCKVDSFDEIPERQLAKAKKAIAEQKKAKQ